MPVTGQRGDGRRECGGFNRLRGMHLESCGEGSRAILGAGVARQRDRWNEAAMFGFMLSNVLDQRVAVLPGRSMSLTTTSGRSTSIA